MDRKTFLNRLILGIDLPGEVLPKTPLIEILGEHRVLVENHSGVAGYCDNEVCINVKFGIVKISGQDLALTRMTGEQLVVSGVIDGVRLCRR